MPTRRHSASATGRSTATSAGSECSTRRPSTARAPRVDTWWRTPPGRVPYEPPSEYGTIYPPENAARYRQLAISTPNQSRLSCVSIVVPQQAA
eukprot:scaffold298294_cov18-Prasinocladus_malaysianus.AAC.1